MKTKKESHAFFPLLSINQFLPKAKVRARNFEKMVKKATANEINRNTEQARRKIESADQVL